MNAIRATQALNRKELEANVSISASWHRDWDHSAYIYIGGLPLELSEGDIITIFSQYGEPVHINLVRDRETGKSRGFAFLKYEDQRSTDLAVDNLGGANVMGRLLRVDHTEYKKKDDEEIYENTYGSRRPEEKRVDSEDGSKQIEGESESESEEERPLLPEEKELAEIMGNHDDDDPMKQYLVKEKQAEVDAAIEKYQQKMRRRKEKERKKHRHRHHPRHHPRSQPEARADSRSPDHSSKSRRRRSRSL